MFQENILLSKYSNYKIGGPARYFFEAKNIEEVIKAIEQAHRIKTSVFTLGAGTNILFSDEGFNGLIIKIQNSKIKIQNGNSKFKIIKVEAGAPLSKLVETTTDTGLSGLEWAAGLPGTVGGAIRGNAGSFGGEIQTIVKEVVSLDISRPATKIIKRNNRDCCFGYRSSVFKLDNKEIILEASLIFKKGDRKAIQKAAEESINYRRERQPLEHPSIGSIFKNVDLKKVPKSRHREFDLVVKNDPFPVIPAAYLISEAGLKGISHGGAMISPKHPNFIVNVLAATAKDVKNLIQLAKKEVKKKFNIELEEEIVHL